MEKQTLFAKITDEYSAKILNWAIKKTGIRQDGEDLAQEVILQVLSWELSLGGSGMMPANPDTNKINESLIKQSICLLCYKDGKTLDELAELTGIPKPYLEFDLEWLVRREFLSLNGKKYNTTFPIVSQKHFQKRGALYQNTRRDYIDRIIEYLWSNEKKIRSPNFYGSDFPTEKLM